MNNKVIVSKYWFGYIVAKAIPNVKENLIGQEKIHRGFNVFGQDLGWYEKPIYDKVTKYIEGEALSASFKTESEALDFVKQINAELI